LEIDSLFNCVDGLIQEGTITPQDDKYGSQEELFADFVTPADLFRLQWVVKGGYKELNNYFRECNATDELISYINATSYDSVAENEGVLASMAEALQLSQTGYYSAITVGVSFKRKLASLFQMRNSLLEIPVHGICPDYHVPCTDLHSVIYFNCSPFSVRSLAEPP
jgi:hypothetical protein